MTPFRTSDGGPRASGALRGAAVLFLAAFAQAAPRTEVKTPARKITVQILDAEDMKNLHLGGTTTFQLAGSRQDGTEVVFGYPDHGRATGIRIDHRLHRLKRIRFRRIPGHPEWILEIWSGPRVTLRLEYHRVPPDDSSNYQGRMILRVNGRRAAFRIEGGYEPA